jgi:hypothetical protein
LSSEDRGEHPREHVDECRYALASVEQLPVNIVEDTREDSEEPFPSCSESGRKESRRCPPGQKSYSEQKCAELSQMQNSRTCMIDYLQ